MRTGKEGEYWVVVFKGGRGTKEIVCVRYKKVYTCGDEEGWTLDEVQTWVRKIRL